MGTTRTTTIILVGVLLMAFGGGVWAQAPAPVPATAETPVTVPVPGVGPAPSVDCITSLANVSDCLTYVEEGSNLTTPEKACCPELAGLVESNPICLCQLLGNTSSFGIQIDINKALKLPSVCGVATPPVSVCSAVGVPVGVPVPNEESPPPGVLPPQGSGLPPQGSGLTPSGNSDNGASSTSDSALAFLVGLAIAVLPTFF